MAGIEPGDDCPDPPDDPFLPHVIPGDEFCVYYRQGLPTQFDINGTSTPALATLVAEDLQSCWDRYNDLGFPDPEHGTAKLRFWL